MSMINALPFGRSDAAAPMPTLALPETQFGKGR
jgi:hypothetical protein